MTVLPTELDSSVVLPLVPGAGENIAMHALPTARNFLFQIPTFPIHILFYFGGGGGVGAHM